MLKNVYVKRKREKEGIRGVWAHVSTNNSHIIPHLVSKGFDFHHALPGNACLTLWIPKNQPSKLPHAPTHQVFCFYFFIFYFLSNNFACFQKKKHNKKLVRCSRYSDG